MSNNKNGFSLIELMVVVIIISLLALFITPNIKGTLRTMRINSFSKSAMAAARLARKTAILEGEAIMLCVDLDNECLYLEFQGKTLERSRYNAPEMVDISSVECDGVVTNTGIVKLQFNPKGTVNGNYNFIRYCYYPEKASDESASKKNLFYTLTINCSSGRPRIINFS